MKLEDIKSLVQEDLNAVDALILESLHSKVSLINELGRYIIQSGGKRFRPLVLLLIAKACQAAHTPHTADQNHNINIIKLATVIEFIHTATLLHDDVVDDSGLRRGRKTANSVWGNEAAVLVGDFLFSKAIQILLSVGNPKIMQVLADTTNIMAEGEALQLVDRHNPETTEGGYLNIICSKTAKLFESAAKIGAILSGASPAIEQAMATYGLQLGMAFQLIDDVLDYESSPIDIGKNIGNDLNEGKVTLPLIHILQRGTPTQIQLIKKAIQNGNTNHLEEIKELLIKTGAIEYTKQFAQLEIKRAQKALSMLSPSLYRDGAESLANLVVERTH